MNTLLTLLAFIFGLASWFACLAISEAEDSYVAAEAQIQKIYGGKTKAPATFLSLAIFCFDFCLVEVAWMIARFLCAIFGA